MEDPDDLPGSEADRMVERDNTYTHSAHGRVTVTGIWRGVEEVDSARNTNQKDVIIVRYSTVENDEPVDELTDTLDEFLDATE
ncbi:hypothetical protein [Natrinema salaciae]|uniref:Uncharacterized protein n=1 Tax=Natrinema salaciae TaxID=1186196 RepID=A0A1H9R198_9EURY|nr:hypothetical protein [Natrinema salaciae]SER66621.1 hypothetical protein SAMN04489841_4247 [Natrinema salaciae]